MDDWLRKYGRQAGTYGTVEEAGQTWDEDTRTANGRPYGGSLGAEMDSGPMIRADNTGEPGLRGRQVAAHTMDAMMNGGPVGDMEKTIGPEQVRSLTVVLQKYHAGLARTKQRIVAAESWWKLRNQEQERKVSAIGADGGFTSVSGWLHNVIANKHADAMESYPEPNILPREAGDREEATKLSSIVPCVLEQNHFESTYSEVMWQKMKYGTGVYKIIWDKDALNGLGDIGIEECNLLNLYWEPGVKDIQKSRFFFHTELWDRDLLKEQYPELLKDALKGTGFLSTRFLYDDSVSTEDKATVVECYYHKVTGGTVTLQYVKYVEDIVLYATENEPSLAARGLYDHGRYPYVFDPLYPIEGSPCGYGYVDVCANPQTTIDLLKTAGIKNAMVGSTPRFFVRSDGKVNEGELLDLQKPLVHVAGSLDEAAVRQITHPSLEGNYIALMEQTVAELRETSGNTETSTGSTPSGVTAASAIAALQEASGKGSRDSTMGSYRAFNKLVELTIELIRQFYDLPRSFRITGSMGQEEFVSYSNQGLQPQHQGVDFGQDMGYRMPVFDIKISAQKKSVYTKISQNELATQFFQMGFFNPQLTDQAMLCLEMMDFDGKEEIMQRIARNGTMQQKLQQYMAMAMQLAAAVDPKLVQSIQQDMAMTMGAAAPAPVAGIGGGMQESDNIRGQAGNEATIVANARERSANAAQPEGGKVKA